MNLASGLRLRSLDGPHERCEPLLTGVTVVGRGECDLVIHDQGVSSRQALLVVHGKEVVLVDCESKNGTWLDGRRVRSGVAEVGAEVAFGPSRWRLERSDPTDSDLALSFSIPLDVLDTPTPSSLVSRDGNPRLVDWLRSLERMVGLANEDRLHRSTRLLEEVLAALRAEAVAYVLIEAEEPTILSSLGDTSRLHLEALFEGHREGRLPTEGESSWLSLGSTVGLARCSGGEVRAVVVSKSGSGPQEAEHFLATALMLLDSSSAPQLRAAAEPVGTTAGLVFPTDYVKSRSQAMEPVYNQLRALTLGDLSVLIVGETGVGKECLVETLHHSSHRREGPLVAINCAAIPRDLLEAELFGIGDRVATGVAGRVGRFRQAQGGTLFLDEIGELPKELQVKLLRVLEERRIEGLGTDASRIDVRVVAATNSDIDGASGHGSLRSDLFYRLAGSVVRVPPIRARKEDIAGLVEVFARQAAAETGKAVRGVSVRALRRLVTYDWPGNVRELKHLTTRLVYQCTPGGMIDLELVERALVGRRSMGSSPQPTLPSMNLEQLERAAIRAALDRSHGNQSRASELLGISRFALRRRIERYQIAESGGSRSDADTSE